MENENNEFHSNKTMKMKTKKFPKNPGKLIKLEYTKNTDTRSKRISDIQGRGFNCISSQARQR